MECVPVVGKHDPSVVAVGGERGCDLPVAELIERCLFPWVLLAAVGGQFGGSGPEGVERGAEPASGGDFGQLMVITDQDRFGPDPGHLIEDSGEVADTG